jgi:hypothetical protein
MAGLGLMAQPKEWCQVRPCNAAGRQEDGFLAKIVSTLEVAPPGYPMVRRPREENFRRPDVVIGTRDWDAVERFLCHVGSKGTLRQTETPKQHVRIVLQNGERWYLNLLMSETAHQSRITSEAVAKLGRGSKHEGCMHLRDVNGREVPISVGVVNTTKELVAGESLPPGELKSHMVLTPEDERRIQGMMLTGWKGKPDLLKGWASQGAKKKRIPWEIQSGRAGEQMKLRNGMTRITVLFDKNVPNTMVRCGTAEMLGWKASKAGQWVTSANGKREYSRTRYQAPLLTTEGYVKLTEACGVLSIAHIETRRTIKGASVDLPDAEKGTTKIIWEWERVDMVIGRDNMNGNPEASLWRSWDPWDSTPGRTWRSSTEGTRRFARAEWRSTGECLAPLMQIFLSTPAQFAAIQRKVEKEEKTLE